MRVPEYKYAEHRFYTMLLCLFGLSVLICFVACRITAHTSSALYILTSIGLDLSVLLFLTTMMFKKRAQFKPHKYSGNMVYSLYCDEQIEVLSKFRLNVVTVITCMLSLILLYYTPWAILIPLALLAVALISLFITIARSKSRIDVNTAALNISEAELSLLRERTVGAIIEAQKKVAVRDLTPTFYTRQNGLYAAQVVSVKQRTGTNKTVCKLIVPELDSQKEWTLVIHEGTAPVVGDTLFLHYLYFTVGKGNCYVSSGNCGAITNIIDIDALREVDFDFVKLQENFNGMQGVVQQVSKFLYTL